MFYRYINKILVINFLVFILLLGITFYFLFRKIGDENKFLVDKEFLCDGSTMQYFSVDFNYNDLSYIKSEIFRNLVNEKYLDATKLITIRFIINCKGEVDGFSVKAIDKHNKTIKLTEEQEKLIISKIKNIGQFPKLKDMYNFNIYYNLKISIKDGKVIDVF